MFHLRGYCVSSMARHKPMQVRVLLALFASAPVLFGQDDARDVIRRAVEADEQNWQAARHYTFSERVDSRYLDSQGRLKSQDIKGHDVLLLDGSPYRRLVSRDDRPLPPTDERKEQEKLDRSIAARLRETAVQRAQRMTEYIRRPEWEREAWHELPAAFDFRWCAEEVLDGRRLYVIEASPRQGYRPGSRTGKVLARLKARFWIDKQDYHIVKAEAEVMETISVGLFLVRVAKGSHAILVQTRVNDDVWMPHEVQAFGSARVGLLKVLRIEHEIRYSNSRKFPAASPLASQVTAK
jgi:hypothetical protein